MEWDEDAARKFLQQVLAIWVGPDIERRRQAGTLGERFVFCAAQVIFYPDGHPPTIRLNNEVKAVAKAKIRRGSGIQKQVGDPILPMISNE